MGPARHTPIQFGVYEVDLVGGEIRKSGVRIATMDLKTACIALASNALLLTANRRDFEKVPGLRFESWLD